jgi:hypothetical protein
MLPPDVSIPAKQNLCSYISGNYKQKYILHYVLSQYAYISHFVNGVALQLIQGNRLNSTNENVYVRQFVMHKWLSFCRAVTKSVL